MSDEAPESKENPEVSRVQFPARLTPENAEHLRLISEVEDLSKNEALNKIIHRHKHYPKDLAEIHMQVQFMLGELEVIQSQLDLCALHEEHLVEMIDNGKVEERLEEMREREEAQVLKETP